MFRAARWVWSKGYEEMTKSLFEKKKFMQQNFSQIESSFFGLPFFYAQQHNMLQFNLVIGYYFNIIQCLIIFLFRAAIISINASIHSVL